MGPWLQVSIRIPWPFHLDGQPFPRKPVGRGVDVTGDTGIAAPEEVQCWRRQVHRDVVLLMNSN